MKKIFNITLVFLFALAAFGTINFKEVFANNHATECGISTKFKLRRLIGEYEGTYVDDKTQQIFNHEMGIYFKVYEDIDGKFSAKLFTYSLSSMLGYTNTDMDVLLNLKTDKYELSGSKWEESIRYHIVGTLSNDVFSGKFINGDDEFTFTAKKVAYEPQDSASEYLDKLIGEYEFVDKHDNWEIDYNLKVFKDDDGRYVGIHSVYSIDQDKNVKSGSFFLYVYYDISANSYKFIGNNWIIKPEENYYFWDNFGILQGDNLICYSGYYGSSSIFRCTKIKDASGDDLNNDTEQNRNTAITVFDKRINENNHNPFSGRIIYNENDKDKYDKVENFVAERLNGLKFHNDYTGSDFYDTEMYGRVYIHCYGQFPDGEYEVRIKPANYPLSVYGYLNVNMETESIYDYFSS